jgi:hypothetical protein
MLYVGSVKVGPVIHFGNDSPDDCRGRWSEQLRARSAKSTTEVPDMYLAKSVDLKPASALDGLRRGEPTSDVRPREI